MTSYQPPRAYQRGDLPLHAIFLRVWIFLACLILGAMSSSVSWAGAGDLTTARPFQVGEQLTFDISWLNITAGTAVMAVSGAGMEGNQTLLKLVTTAQSRPAITKFFPVDNRVESLLDPATLQKWPRKFEQAVRWRICYR